MNRRLFFTGLSLVLLLFLFLAIDPARMPLPVLILPFVFLFVLLMNGVSYVLEVCGVSERKNKQLSILAASSMILLLVLQSIGQLTIRDTAIAGILFVLAYFYIVRISEPT